MSDAHEDINKSFDVSSELAMKFMELANNRPMSVVAHAVAIMSGSIAQTSFPSNQEARLDVINFISKLSHVYADTTGDDDAAA